MKREYKLKFMLEYGTDCLWSADDKTENKFGYQIENLSEVGLSEITIGLSEFVSDLYYLRLNPIYQMLPSFWSGEMHLFFQNKVKELYEKVIMDINDKFEIVISPSAKIEMEEKVDVEKINVDLKIFLDNPVEYFVHNKIHFTEKQFLIEEVKKEYNLWRMKEERYLK